MTIDLLSLFETLINKVLWADYEMPMFPQGATSFLDLDQIAVYVIGCLVPLVLNARPHRETGAKTDIMTNGHDQLILAMHEICTVL